MYHFDENRAFLKARLSKKRYTHSLNVAHEAQRLAELYGEDPEKAYFAGLMHDVCKELPAEEQEELVRASSFAVSKEELVTKPVWHGIAGAYFLQVRMGVTDPDVLNAVRYHTVGRAGMTRLEEIVTRLEKGDVPLSQSLSLFEEGTKMAWSRCGNFV